MISEACEAVRKDSINDELSRLLDNLSELESIVPELNSRFSNVLKDSDVAIANSTDDTAKEISQASALSNDIKYASKRIRYVTKQLASILERCDLT